MKNLYYAIAVLVIHIGITYFSTKIPSFVDADSAPVWYSVFTGIIAVLYMYFGYQMAKKENHRIAGTVFCLLALCTAFLVVMMNAKY